MGMQRTLGINGLGRIGKLTLWHHLGNDDFDRIVVNLGRPVGTSLDSVVQYIAKANAYGAILQGLDRPAVDVSRGATAHDVLGVAAIVGLQSIAYRSLYPGAGQKLPGES